MLTKKLKKYFAKSVEENIKDSIEANDFHNRISNEILESTKRMKSRQKDFRIIRNK